jgi:hypothetical protein
MQIPGKLPQFESERALLLVAGKQDAVLYEAREGRVEKLLDIRVPKPHYSDDEGHFKVRVGGKTIRSGSVKEIRDEDIIRDFLHALKEEIRPLMHQEFTHLFLFAPAKTKNRIREELPHHWQQAIAEVIEGNFYYRNPLYLLERISVVTVTAPSEPSSKEAKKILEHSQQASEVIRTREI